MKTLGYSIRNEEHHGKKKQSPSKLDAEDDQNLSVFNEVAVTTIWFDDLNNEYEETFNEEEENGETLTEDAIYEIVLTINHMI